MEKNTNNYSSSHQAYAHPDTGFAVHFWGRTQKQTTNF